MGTRSIAGAMSTNFLLQLGASPKLGTSAGSVRHPPAAARAETPAAAAATQAAAAAATVTAGGAPRVHIHELLLADPNVVYAELHGGWKCDGCGASEPALCYNCPVCTDPGYDLCAACVARGLGDLAGAALDDEELPSLTLDADAAPGAAGSAAGSAAGGEGASEETATAATAGKGAR